MSARLRVTGIDAQGRSCVIHQRPLTLEDSGLPGLSSTTLYATPACPTIAPASGWYADAFDLDLPPSATRWMVVEYQPYTAFQMHHTDSIDFDVVLTGTAELTLDDGVHDLRVGDRVVVTGVDHAWRAGPDGCRLSVTSIGARVSASDLVRKPVREQR